LTIKRRELMAIELEKIIAELREPAYARWQAAQKTLERASDKYEEAKAYAESVDKVIEYLQKMDTDTDFEPSGNEPFDPSGNEPFKPSGN